MAKNEVLKILSAAKNNDSHDKTRNSETDTSVSDQNLESSKMIPNQSCMNLAIFLPN